MKDQPDASVDSLDIATDAIDDSSAFAPLGLPEHLLQTVAELGFAEPTTIQVMAIPPLMAGRDVIGQARTGTGKTAAFGLPLIARLQTRRPGPAGVRALVLTPTRELALQVTDAIQALAKGLPLRVLTVYGGSAYGPQLRGLREGSEIVVGTPGRVIDLMERGNLVLDHVEMVVLDEADEMLEMGFIDAVETILAGTPATRQVALFSATMPDPIRRVAQRHLKDPVSAKEATQTILAIAQKYVQVPQRFKIEALVRILRSEVRDATLVFASTRAACADAADALIAAGIPAEPLHGDLAQAARERVVEMLRQRRVQVVVATDIAARGIDIDHLTHIVNLDLPKNIEVYTHRIGRTGRAGRNGTAITLVQPREAQRFIDALGRRGTKVEEMFLASEHDLAMRKRDALTGDLGRFLAEAGPPESLDEARKWVSRLVDSGLGLEDLTTSLLGLLAEARGLGLGAPLDKGLPPWARQPMSASGPANRATQAGPRSAPPPQREQRDYAGPPQREQREYVRPPQRDYSGPRQNDYRDQRDYSGPPQREQREYAPRPPVSRGLEAPVRIGIGRRLGARPADIVGALTNELGLTGQEIGRVELRDDVTIVGVPQTFVARLGNDTWPMQVRGIDTTIVRHDEVPFQVVPPRAPRPSYDDGPRGPVRDNRDGGPPRGPFRGPPRGPGPGGSPGAPHGPMGRTGERPPRRATAR